MLWAGLGAFLFAVILAANGRFSPTAFGIGIGLLVMWFFFDREPAATESTEEERSDIADALHESSTEFDLEDFPAFLRRVASHVTRGMGEREIERLLSRAQQLPHNRESQTELQVVFQGAGTPLRIHMFKDDVASIGVAFFTSKPLADLLDREMDAFFAERGM